MVLKDRRFFGEPPQDEVLLSPDARIEADVASALANNREVDAVDVTVNARNGEVTLAGSVALPEEIARCEEIARQANGVVSVRNLIGVWASET